MKSSFFILMFALLSGFSAGCSKGGGDKGGDKEKVYDIKGKVVSLDAAKKTIRLDHQEIPGFMDAMEMPFDVVDAKVLSGLKAGDQVRGKLKVKSGVSVITELHKQ